MTRTRSQEWIEWNNLPNVYAYRKKDEDDYPPTEWEQLKAKPTDIEGIYQLKNIPFFARGLASDDEVVTQIVAEGFSPVIKSIYKRSGFSTVRILITDEEDRQALINHFTKYGCRLEFCREFKGHVAIAIPKDSFDEVYGYILKGKESGRWGAEDGFIAEDEKKLGDEFKKFQS